MVKTTLLKTTCKTALLAAIMSGSALMAQEAPVASPEAAAPPVAQTPPATVVAPPPVVRTLPTENDIVNPAAAEQAAAEQKPARAAAQSERKAAPTPTVRTTRANSVATPSPAPAPAADVVPTFNELTAPVTNTITETPTIADDQPAVVEVPSDNVDESAEDLTLFAGLAAALAALGLGGLLVARRRNKHPNQDYRAAAVAQPIPEPRPVYEPRPVFQPVASPIAVERPLVRKPVMSRPDIPVTDPLFSTPVHAGPITDPLFAPRNDVEIPITDPLFAKNERFSGRARDAEPALIPEPVN